MAIAGASPGPPAACGGSGARGMGFSPPLCYGEATMFGFGSAATFLLLAILAGASGVKVIREYERAVIFRLGRLIAFKGAGVRYIIPFIDKMYRIDLRTVTLDVPPQDVITRDNVSVKVNAVLYFRVIDPNKAVTEVENYLVATSQLAQTTLRSVCGEVELDELLSEREQINARLQKIIDTHTDPWGIKVVQVAVKHIDLPEEMRRAMARQAEAERERRAKIIKAEGEYQAAEKLLQASEIIGRQPGALQLRFLQSLTEVAGQQNSTTIFPVPIDLFSNFLVKKD
jgi:regulator of protease activity HflC (stomatin/prohibitin superfamily)